MQYKECVLQIRCSSETKKRFKTFVATHGFKSYEEALLALIKKAEEYKWLLELEKVKGKIY